ncbi:MAG: zinc ribbon domain-containing protein [Eubacteriales bacterium]|nr:zinc ribbon domain-containing protein [Eubacteriales bacterium]
MPWMQLDAQVYYGQGQYDESRAPDAVVEGATDHEGRYLLRIPVPEDNDGPVGILLTGTLQCVYPFDGGKDAFYFVDMQDGFSKDNNKISLSTWLMVDPTDFPEAKPDAPISVYRLLSFYNLGLGAWSFDAGLDRLQPDPVHHYNADAEHAKRLENYSTLYTAAFDAWFLGAVTLDETDSMTSQPLRIEVRWPVDPAIGCSHYQPGENCIRLEETDSLRDDNSRFTLLHEFGHAFDFITNGKFRAYAEYGPGNENHGGYFNDTTSDSYIEGFATFFAGTVQLYGGYKNPHILSWIDLGTPGGYIAWKNNGKSEEFAIATLLYNTHALAGDIKGYWGVLDADRENFYEYYTAVEAYLAQKSPEAARKLRQYAIAGGLYRMPFGSGRYDPGEPFRGLPGGTAGRRDANEPYADLMFGVDENGRIDPAKPLREYDESSLTAGQSSDALRARKTIQPPHGGYLYLSGKAAEYLLVDILPNGEQGSRTLRAVDDARVVIGLPDRELTGSVRVSVPGGNVIYEGDLAELQQRQTENAGQAVPLAEARISAADLAPAGTEVAATYGDVNASGVLPVPEMSYEELVRLAEGYEGDAGLEEIAAALAARTDKGATPWDGNGFVPATGAWRILLYIAAGLGALAIVLLILFLCLTPRAKAPGPQPVPGHQAFRDACANCGAALAPGAAFCSACGTPAPALRPRSPAFCIGCGAQLAPGAVFCIHCGQARPPQPAYAPPQAKRPKLWLIFALAAAAAAVLCVGVYFLLCAGKPLPAQTADKPAAGTAATVSEPAPVQMTQPPLPGVTPEMVSNQTITVNMAYDSGEGTYTGEMNDGVPHGQGSFIMQKSDKGMDWSYEGQWENGEIAGEGVKKEGSYVSTGTFRGGLLNGNGAITDNGVLRYQGMWADGKLHAAGTLYIKSGTRIFEGAFENDMLVETKADRKRRGEAFKPQCEDMDELMYGVIMDDHDSMDYPVHVWGFSLGMAEQAASGTIVIGHFADGGYPVCLLYRYAVGEPKMTGDDWINAWGVVTGLFAYTDETGNPAICPQVEVIYWDSEQEGQ